MLNQEIIGQRLTIMRGKEPRANVAKACGISISALGMYETGRRIPRDKIKVKLAEHYKTTVQQLFYA